MPRGTLTWGALLVFPAALCLSGLAETVPPLAAKAVEVVLERTAGEHTGQAWAAVDARTVFRAGEELRFRFQSNFAGFLYVLDRTPAGEQMWLFPTAQTGEENQIEANHEYLIPATGGSFRIPDTPGYDTVFWIVSPVPLNGFTGLPAHPKPLHPLLPRCRLECLDSAAGPHALEKGEVPAGLSPLRARDLTVKSSPESTKIKATVQGPGPLIYEFRIAHR